MISTQDGTRVRVGPRNPLFLREVLDREEHAVARGREVGPARRVELDRQPEHRAEARELRNRAGPAPERRVRDAVVALARVEHHISYKEKLFQTY